MDARRVVHAGLALAAMVFLSSYFGLGGLFFWMDPVGVLGFMGGIWADSIAADVVFTAGTIGAAILGWHLSARHWAWGVLGGALAHWAVYGASFLLLEETRADAEFAPIDAFLFVARWGFVGLAFAALAPPLARRWIARRARVEDAVPA